MDVKPVKCPICGLGEMKAKTLINYATRMNGHPIIVPTAHIAKCSSCGEIVVSANELKYWETLVQKESL